MDNIHYIQAFLNPVYKHLKKIGVPNARIQRLYKKIEKILQGIRRELPQLFNKSEDEANSAEEDSDKDSCIKYTKNRRLKKTSCIAGLSTSTTKVILLAISTTVQHFGKLLARSYFQASASCITEPLLSIPPRQLSGVFSLRLVI